MSVKWRSTVYLRSKVRVFIRTPSGRKRYNVLGVYHAIRGTMITVTNATYINFVECGGVVGQVTEK